MTRTKRTRRVPLGMAAFASGCAVLARPQGDAPSEDYTLQDNAEGHETPETATGADMLVARLASAGATHAFGIPGGEVLALVDALERAGVRFCLARHENAAGFMAEGLWRTTGAPPVLIATLGPGVANAVNVVANSRRAT